MLLFICLKTRALSAQTGWCLRTETTLGGRTAAAVTTDDALVTIQRENVLKIFVYNRPFIYFELRPDNNRLLIMINASIERRYMLTSFWNLIWPKLFFCLIAIEGTVFEVSLYWQFRCPIAQKKDKNTYLYRYNDSY